MEFVQASKSNFDKKSQTKDLSSRDQAFSVFNLREEDILFRQNFSRRNFFINWHKLKVLELVVLFLIYHA
jgi:hypothetical protein